MESEYERKNVDNPQRLCVGARFTTHIILRVAQKL